MSIDYVNDKKWQQIFYNEIDAAILKVIFAKNAASVQSVTFLNDVECAVRERLPWLPDMKNITVKAEHKFDTSEGHPGPAYAFTIKIRWRDDSLDKKFGLDVNRLVDEVIWLRGGAAKD